jgi:hypothetical protein
MSPGQETHSFPLSYFILQAIFRISIKAELTSGAEDL